jgi:hypothetical protein
MILCHIKTGICIVVLLQDLLEYDCHALQQCFLRSWQTMHRPTIFLLLEIANALKIKSLVCDALFLGLIFLKMIDSREGQERKEMV